MTLYNTRKQAQIAFKYRKQFVVCDRICEITDAQAFIAFKGGRAVLEAYYLNRG